MRCAAISTERDALAAERESLNAQLSGRTRQLTAPVSGYFSDIVDGYENVLTPDGAGRADHRHFHELTQERNTVGFQSSMGKIIQGFSWYLVARSRPSRRDRLSVGQNLRVNFTQASLEVAGDGVFHDRGA